MLRAFFAITGVTLALTAVALPIRFRLPSGPLTWDWNIAHTSNETYILMNIMSGLLESGTDLKVKPSLAERWSISPDGLEYTFYLREDALWSDGAPVIAQHFVDSWKRLLSPSTKSGYASFLMDIVGAEDYSKTVKPNSKTAETLGIKAVGSKIFRVTLKKPSPAFIHIPTFWVTFPIRSENTKLFAQRKLDVSKILVTGPYRPLSWVQGSEDKGKSSGSKIILEPNPHYKLPRSHQDKIYIIIEKDAQNARTLFNQGELDFLLQASTRDYLAFQTQQNKLLPGVTPLPLSQKERFVQIPYLSTTYLGFSTTMPPLTSQALRKAISLVIRSEKSRWPTLLQGGQMEAESWVPSSILGFRKLPLLKNPLYEARQLLIQAGFQTPDSIAPLTICSELFDRSEILVSEISALLETKLGLRIKILQLPNGVAYIDALKKKRCSLFITHWGGDYPDPHNFYSVFKSDSYSNYSSWNNPIYSQLLKESGESLEPKQRESLYQKADALLIERDAVIVPLFYPKNALILGDKIKSLALSPLNYLYLKDTLMEESKSPLQ